MDSDTRSQTAARPLRRPRLRTILLCVNVLILLLPLAGIAALRLYESELVRSTEAELLVQGVHVRQLYREAYLDAEGRPSDGTTPPDPQGVLAPGLDASKDKVLPPPPPAVAPGVAADPIAVAAGADVGPALEAAAQETLAGIRIVDRSGIVVASTGPEKGMSLLAREEVARALRGERVSLMRQRIPGERIPTPSSLSRGQDYRVVVSLPVAVEGRGVVGAVLLLRTPMDVGKALYLNRRSLLLGAASLLAVVAAISVLTAFTIVRPARRIVEVAERVARGERGAASTIPEPGTREMADLSRAIAGMARSLEQRADSIRTFASHVSHEFKTPLSTIRGTTELLRDHLTTMSPEERERFLSILDETAERMERLVRRLLDLARADVAEPGEKNAVVKEALEEAAEDARAAGLPVEVIISADVARVRMGRETLKEVLGNLLDNARVHGGPEVRARMHAHLDTSASPPWVEISVADNGAGISAANAGRIFTPFFTTARDRGGSGLGLSIVRTLLEAHGGSIRLRPTREGPAGRNPTDEPPGAEGHGTEFVLRIPAGFDT